MKYKPNWDDTQERLTALWQGRALGRPCLAVTAPSGRAPQTPPLPPDPEARWMDPDTVLSLARAQLENTWWGGESIPSFLLMGGWVVSLGGTPHFDTRTIWFDPQPCDFEKPPPFRYDPADPWVIKHRRLYERMLDAAGWDDFLVGQPCFLPANDLLSMHMGTDTFLLALVDHPEWMREAILNGVRGLIQARRELRELAKERHRFPYGIAGWMPFWAPQSFIGTQSDVSCLLSPDLFETFIVPELDAMAQQGEALWYHLDGGNARQHLPHLLSMPALRVIQYTPMPSEPPNGPEHLALYRQIQVAGRIVHIDVPPNHVEPLVRALDPGLLILQIHCSRPEEGQELIRAAERWTASRSYPPPQRHV